MTAAAAYERLSGDPRLAHLPDVARVVLATAWADGEPLRPITVTGDAEVLVVAELHVLHGGEVRVAIERARTEEITDATLRGAVRYAASRHAQDHLGVELMEHGIRSVRDLDRATAAEFALWLDTLPADEPNEEAFIAALVEMAEPETSLDKTASEPEPEPELFGSALGGCYACGNPVGDDDGTIGVRYFIPGRRCRDGTISDGRYEWRTFSPAVERGDYDSADGVAKRAGMERRSELLRQARGGADLLCLACATRAKYGLLEWPDVDDGDLDSQWREAVDRDRGPEDTVESERAETDAVPLSPEPAAAVTRPEPVAITWPDPHPLIDENVALEAAIFGTECSLVDRRRLDKVADAYPEFMARRGALFVAITALAWERGRPLHLRTNPEDVGRLEQLCVLALNGASVDRALEKEAA